MGERYRRMEDQKLPGLEEVRSRDFAEEGP